ncbi:MAG: penicillin-binding protein 2 [Actinomycetota bacterium]|jgi:penicillin-binding protein 2|nr:penicillin-binding protein 2 [Euzebyaceae bacterium]MDQ3453380.1 penicillin-binding protein 2 [Actinomycetota bacterium]
MVKSRFVRASRTPSAEAQLESTRLRLTFLSLLVVSLFLLLFARLWFLQVMAGDRYASLAQGNAVRTVSVTAPRGKLLDRNGKDIVVNRYARVVSVQPAEMGERADEVLADLADLLGMSLRQVRREIASSQVSPLRPKPIAVDVPSDIVFYLHENASSRFPGVYAETIPVRAYPHGTTAAHAVGYVGQISESELEQPEYEGYRAGDVIGWAGLERTYEAQLQGHEGLRRLEVNAKGDVLRELDDVLPTPGSDIRTTLDLRMQKLTEKSLAEGIVNARSVDDTGSGPGRGGTYKAPAGAVVVLDPDNGEVIALASYPDFQPERFVGGVDTRYWRWLQHPRNDFPLINRVAQSSYPPGSVFKVVSAAAALSNGYVTPSTTVPCPGYWDWNGQIFRNWNPADSGSMTIDQALQYSCDTVFYELARRMWTDEQQEGEQPRERLSSQAKAWGFGALTGLDLPSERAGVVPGRKWKQQFWEDNRRSYCTQAKRAPDDSDAQALFVDLCQYGNTWRGGDSVNMSIGQGDLQTTPLQIANGFAAIANGGTLYRPHVAKAIVQPDGSVRRIKPKVMGKLPVSAKHRNLIAEGLEKVTAEGTAAGTFADFPLKVAGKTGTAEFKPKQPFAWFAAYAPADDPEYVVVTMVEEGGGGSVNAAPIARRILEGLLGLDTTEIEAGLATD